MNKLSYDHIEEVIYKEKLRNGLSVFLLPKPEMAKTYGIFSTDYGSIDQTFVPINGTEHVTVPEGVAHFLEHKMFEKADRDVFDDFGKQGASANAYTSFTKTAYLFAATNHIEQNVETLLDFVQDPYFTEESVEKEKGIIAQEIEMYNDQPDWRSFTGTLKAMFHQHPVKIDIPGTVDSIQTMTKDDLYTCYNTFYHPENMTLFIAGNFDVQQMMDLIRHNQASKDFAKMEDINRAYPKEPDSVAEKEKNITMPVQVPKCTVGIKESSSELTGEAFLKQDLLQDMVVDFYFSKGGPFYQQLYDQQLIDASFYFDTSLEKNFGYTFIGGNTSEPDQFADKVRELLGSTNNKVFSAEEVERMKKKKIGQLLRAMNSLEFMANQYIHYDIVGVDLFTIIPFIQSLTVDDFNAFVQSWIDDKRVAVCKIVNE
ncbi:EF-P 5-aminopentanol modification-associated protein YfmH [Lentibacillus sp. CBA3610]|uniref:EF-P 5-aminopentanol modification-associated protein YfmH n=1 Tax=Lentibacillus sp. CBA3610 TaxID=2518176 RepID=UPI001594F063|nr:pitrilysin family protein [Lentibacillus sp. CBA3610]QKY69081.1 insulinase family protein [Lentibacillus sp. CBA3610]